MKLVVIVADACHVINAGGELERSARVFDMPDDIRRYIETAHENTYASVSLAITDDAQPKESQPNG